MSTEAGFIDWALFYDCIFVYLIAWIETYSLFTILNYAFYSKYQKIIKRMYLEVRMLTALRKKNKMKVLREAPRLQVLEDKVQTLENYKL